MQRHGAIRNEGRPITALGKYRFGNGSSKLDRWVICQSADTNFSGTGEAAVGSLTHAPEGAFATRVNLSRLLCISELRG